MCWVPCSLSISAGRLAHQLRTSLTSYEKFCSVYVVKGLWHSQSSSSSSGFHFTKKFESVTKTTCGCSDASEFLSFFDSAAVAGLRFFLILLLLFPLTACADLHPATRDFLNFCNIEKKHGTVALYSALLKFDNNSRFQNILFLLLKVYRYIDTNR